MWLSHLLTVGKLTMRTYLIEAQVLGSNSRKSATRSVYTSMLGCLLLLLFLFVFLLPYYSILKYFGQMYCMAPSDSEVRQH